MESVDLTNRTRPLDSPIGGEAGWRWDHSYAALPEAFYQRIAPRLPADPSLVLLNAPLAEVLGLDPAVLSEPAGVAALSGGVVPPGVDPIAQAYAGHQFGSFTMLGDGRAVLLGEHLAPDGHRVDIQLKGAGRTAFARGGDGLAALGPMLREYLVSEAMHGLGIPTTRSLAVLRTDDPVQRETQLDGAVLVRVASSHLRVGTFEYAARFVGPDAVKTLADYALQRHFPDLHDSATPYRDLFVGVMQRQAGLVAKWMGVGFVHGVMNTDNVAIGGETIDYGPCAFLDAYHPSTVFSSIDTVGRYAFGNQPVITQWNLARFAEALLPLLAETPDEAVAWAQDRLGDFAAVYREAWLGVMRPKLGLFNAEDSDEGLIQDFLSLLADERADFTNRFRALADGLEDEPGEPDGYSAWRQRWRERLSRQPQPDVEARQRILAHCPAFIPRNLKVEQALTTGCEGDLSLLRRMLEVLGRPYDGHPGHEDLQQPAPSDAPPYRTFCGT